MSSTGVRKESSQDSRIIRGLIENEKAFVESLKPFSSESAISGLGGSGSSSPNSGTPSGNFLPIPGGTMTGFLSFRPVDIFMSGDTIDMTDPDNQSNRIIVTGEASVDDDVKWIKIADPVPDTPILLEGVIGITLTIKNQAASPPDANHRKLRTPLGTDLTLAGNSNIWIVYDSVSNEFAVVSDAGSSSGGGLSEPLLHSVKDYGSVGLGTVNITTDTHNVHKMIITGDIGITINSTLAVGKFEMIHLHLVQDNLGGHNVTSWINVNGTPTIDIAPNSVTTVSLFSLDQGVTWFFVSNKGGVINGTSFSGNLSDLVIDISKNWNAKSITNLASLQYVDTGAVSRGTISGDAGASALRLSTASAGKFIISDVITDIAEFTDVVGLKILGNHVINMNKNIINTTKEIQFDGTAAFAPTTANTIGFDSVSKILKSNVGLTSHSHGFYAAGELLAAITRVAANSGQMNVDNVVSKLLQANTQLFLASTATPSPLFDGAVWQDTTTGLLKARQNGVTENLIGIGTTSLVALTDTTITTPANNDHLVFNSTSGKWENNPSNNLDSPWTVNHDAAGFNLNKLSAMISNATNPAATGIIRLGNNESIKWRSFDNTFDVGLSVDTSNRIVATDPVIPIGSSVSLGASSRRWGTAWVSDLDVLDTLLVKGTVSLNKSVTMGTADTDNIILRGNVNRDIKFNVGFTVNFNAAQNTVGAAGIADAVPAKPDQWIIVKQGGTEYVIPAFAKV